MTNTFMNGLKSATNYTHTENGAITHKSTLNALYDMFAMGGAYRSRSENDCIVLFKNAYAEDPVYALKCLFYLRDIRGGQGERRFFRTCMHWLAKNHSEAARRNLQLIPEYGRWDDLYCLVDTPLEKDAFSFIKKQLALDLDCKTPSLLAKWLKSENTSSAESKALGYKTRKYLNISPKQYRKVLSILRSRINILEKLMSENRWDEIEFDKIPSRAGFIYKNAFARHDLERAKSDRKVQTYAEFAKDETKTVNAKTLYPYECVAEVFKYRRGWSTMNMTATDRAMINKYWDNLADYIKGAEFNGLAVVDTSGSMVGTPLNVAISLGMYCAEKAKGPYHNHFITFSEYPNFVQVEGVDFVDKVNRMSSAGWSMNTNLEAVFDMLLNVAIRNNCTQDEIPQNLIIISDMEFDAARGYARSRNNDTLVEGIAHKWAQCGYKMPHIVFWNVDARQNNIPMTDKNGISFVSGFSPVLYEQIMKGKTATALMYDKLNSERYKPIK